MYAKSKRTDAWLGESAGCEPRGPIAWLGLPLGEGEIAGYKPRGPDHKEISLAQSA